MRSIRFVLSLLFALVLFALVTLAMPSPSFAQFGVLISIPPPYLPVYEQPVIPGPGYLWTPGYWAWSPSMANIIGCPAHGCSAPGWGSMDSGLLGLGRQRVQLESRVLGSAYRVLRRCQLWIRIHW